MNEKRFVSYFDKEHNYIIQDVLTKDEYQLGYEHSDEYEFLELVNALAEEKNNIKKEESNKMDNYKEEYIKLVEKYEKLHDKLYARDYFEVEYAGEYTADSRQFKNGLCVFNNRLGMAYSVTEIVEVLNTLTAKYDLIMELIDDRLEILEHEVNRCVKAGMPTSTLYTEINDLETLKIEIKKIMEE